MDALKDTAAGLTGATRSDPLNPSDQPPNESKGDGPLAAATQKGGELLEQGIDYVQTTVLGQKKGEEQQTQSKGRGVVDAQGGGTDGAAAIAADSTVEDFIRDRYKSTAGDGTDKKDG